MQQIDLKLLKKDMKYLKDKVDKMMEILEAMPQCYMSKESFNYEKKELETKMKTEDDKNDERIKRIERMLQGVLALSGTLLVKILYDVIILLFK